MTIKKIASASNTNIYLTGNPQITFWKMVYKRHTHFALDTQELNLQITDRNKYKVDIKANTFLLYKTHIEINLPEIKKQNGAYYTDAVAHALIDKITLKINNQEIDTHSGEWFDIISELTTPEDKIDGYNNMIGKKGTYNRDVLINNKGGNKLFLPLRFFFCESPGLAFPLNLLKHSHLTIEFDFHDISHIIENYSSTNIFKDNTKKEITYKVFTTYVILSDKELNNMQIPKKEKNIYYLIPAVKQIPRISIINSSDITYNNISLASIHGSIRELIWIIRNKNETKLKYNHKHMEECGFFINNISRLSLQSAEFFTHIQPYIHHTRVPSKSIYVYSFALKPEDVKPNGTCNFTGIYPYLQMKLKNNPKNPNEFLDIDIFAPYFKLITIDRVQGNITMEHV